MRLNRFLAAAGLGSRRACEQYILSGELIINGAVCTNLAYQVGQEDEIIFRGKRLHTLTPVTLLLHKPAGYVTTRDDPHASQTIFELLPPKWHHLFHVGRLDQPSEGLLLLTNDGLLAQRLMHPSRGVEKEYEVTLNKPFGASEKKALEKGMWIEGKMARIHSCHLLSPYKIRLILHQGLKRQIRVMLGHLGFRVKRLIRIRIGSLLLERLPRGKFRELQPQELQELQQLKKNHRLHQQIKKEPAPNAATSQHALDSKKEEKSSQPDHSQKAQKAQKFPKASKASKPSRVLHSSKASKAKSYSKKNRQHREDISKRATQKRPTQKGGSPTSLKTSTSSLAERVKGSGGARNLERSGRSGAISSTTGSAKPIRAHSRGRTSSFGSSTR